MPHRNGRHSSRSTEVVRNCRRHTPPDDEQVCQFATSEVDDQQLTVRMLSADLVGRDAPSFEALKAAIIRNKAVADPFREPMAFRKVQP